MNRNERIKYLLEKKGVSYDAVGEKLKIGKAAVSNRLNRAKEIDDEDFIKAIVEATGYPEEMILNGDGFQEVFFSENYVNEPPSNYQTVLLELAEIKGEKKKLEDENAWLRSLVERLPGAK